LSRRWITHALSIGGKTENVIVEKTIRPRRREKRLDGEKKEGNQKYLINTECMQVRDHTGF
jgi:hypothetical protein